MKLVPISAGSFHCDGGALFGVIPKVLWSKVYPVDDKNFTRLSLRCLLVDQGERKILIETGIGNHYPEKHLQNNGVTSVTAVSESLKTAGYSTDEITDVFFTHLHWDHCTGAVRKADNGYELVFSKAKMWCSSLQWEHAKVSNPRERAAYNREVLDFMYESGQLNFIEEKGQVFPDFEVRFFHGHTPGHMIPLINTGKYKLAYMSDLIPTTANIPLLWIAAYDLDPVLVMQEKEAFLQEAVDKDYILFFEHDYYAECARLTQNEKGIVVKEKGKLGDWTG